MEEEEKFDVIIVGGGVAGLTSAYFLAEKGYNVLVLERGKELGSKNMFGGRIYTHVLERLLPDYRNTAPIERWVTKDWFVFLDEKKALLLEYNWIDETDSFTTYLTKFVSWLGSKAENAGALIATGVRVEELIVEGKEIRGVIADGEKIEANYVIIAEGVPMKSLGLAVMNRLRKASGFNIVKAN